MFCTTALHVTRAPTGTWLGVTERIVTSGSFDPFRLVAASAETWSDAGAFAPPVDGALHAVAVSATPTLKIASRFTAPDRSLRHVRTIPSPNSRTLPTRPVALASGDSTL
jgi:hypothetical protein